MTCGLEVGQEVWGCERCEMCRLGKGASGMVAEGGLTVCSRCRDVGGWMRKVVGGLKNLVKVGICFRSGMSGESVPVLCFVLMLTCVQVYPAFFPPASSSDVHSIDCHSTRYYDPQLKFHTIVSRSERALSADIRRPFPGLANGLDLIVQHPFSQLHIKPLKCHHIFTLTCMCINDCDTRGSLSKLAVQDSSTPWHVGEYFLN